ncbi:MAG: hypothetical protein Q4D78_06485 [Neisseria zoodegmatis]|uniref:hypothetical protein n=1 Tax=Neisseria zoodegmatis TaxID=326523 RepID=UPI0026ED4567|nr:hypothetical protein [Neisseria zoodegmatis]MDO5069833.1 hypothetical protein [Neisseria zoodegmatis]
MSQTENHPAAVPARGLKKLCRYKQMLWLLFFFGGPAGALVYALSRSVFFIAQGGAVSFSEIAEVLPWIVWMGWLLGVIPAMLTGFAVVLSGLFRGWRGSMLMAATGAAVSFLYGYILMGWEVVPVGAVSAWLFSRWLPKRDAACRAVSHD